MSSSVPAPRSTHVYRYEVPTEVERAVLDGEIRPGLRALDVGCAATGRTARLLRELGAEVVSIELVTEAIQLFSKSGDAGGIRLVSADMRVLPFANERFDLVLVGFHGFDYLLTPTDRRRALREFDRVLAPGGRLIFDTFNRWSAPFAFEGRPTRRLLRHRLRYFAHGGPLRATFDDVNGITLRHDTAACVRGDVESSTSLRFGRLWDGRGRPQPWSLARFVVAHPTFRFDRLESTNEVQP